MTLTETRKRLRALHEAATKTPWRSMRDGNQYVETRHMPTAKCVATSAIPEVVRPWNPHAVIAFMKLDDANESRFCDADADLIAESRNSLPALLDALDQAEAALSDAMCGAPDWFDNAAAALAAMKGEASDECSK